MLQFESVGLRYGRIGGRLGAAAGPEVLHDISFRLETGAFRWLLARPVRARPVCFGCCIWRCGRPAVG